MSTNNHTAITVGQSNAPATINTPLGELDAAIGNLSTTGVSGASAAAQLATTKNRIDNLNVDDSGVEVGAARNAGLTDGTVSSLSTRLEYAAANAYHPMAYGANGDGSTDDRATLNTLFNTTMSAGGYAIIDRNYSIQSALTVPAGVGLRFNLGGKFTIGKFSIRSATYRWTTSGSGTAEYYLELAAGGDPGVTVPAPVYANGTRMETDRPGILAAGQCGYGDNDSLGYDTVYVRLSDGADPDAKAAGYIELGYVVTINGPIEAPYRQIFDGDGIAHISTETGTVIPQWFGSWTDADDAIGINLALMSRGTSAGAVYLPAGEYNCSTTIDFNAGTLLGRNRTLYGEGTATLLKLAVDSIDLIKQRKVGTLNDAMQNFSVSGAGRTASGKALIRAEGNYIWLRDITVIDPPTSGYGIYVGQAWSTNTFDVLMRGIFVQVDTATGATAGIKFYRASDCRLIDCQIAGGSATDGDYSTYALQYCVDVEDSNTIDFSDCHWFHARDYTLRITGDNGRKMFNNCRIGSAGIANAAIICEGASNESRLHQFNNVYFQEVKGRQHADDTSLTAGGIGLLIKGFVRSIWLNDCFFEPNNNATTTTAPAAGAMGMCRAAIKTEVGSGSEEPRNIYIRNPQVYQPAYYQGQIRVTHGSVTSGPFVAGETVTGGTSNATGVVRDVEDNYLILADTLGTFQAAETLTGGTSSATATSDLVEAYHSAFDFLIDSNVAIDVMRATSFSSANYAWTGGYNPQQQTGTRAQATGAYQTILRHQTETGTGTRMYMVHYAMRNVNTRTSGMRVTYTRASAWTTALLSDSSRGAGYYSGSLFIQADAGTPIEVQGKTDSVANVYFVAYIQPLW